MNPGGTGGGGQLTLIFLLLPLSWIPRIRLTGNASNVWVVMVVVWDDNIGINQYLERFPDRNAENGQTKQMWKDFFFFFKLDLKHYTNTIVKSTIKLVRLGSKSWIFHLLTSQEGLLAYNTWNKIALDPSFDKVWWEKVLRSTGRIKKWDRAPAQHPRPSLYVN